MCDEVILLGNWPRKLNLEVATGLADANAIILAEAVTVSPGTQVSAIQT
jgi:hypothetical protein